MEAYVQLKGYHLRPLRETDLHSVLEWRNSERVHSKMLTDHTITWEEHKCWFDRIKNNDPVRNLILEYQGKAVGYVGYTEYDAENDSCSPGAYMGDTENIPIEAGLYLFFLSLEYAFGELNMKRLETSVFEDNRKARKINEFLGYKKISAQPIFYMKNGERKEAYRYALSCQDWQKKRVDIIELL